MRKGEPVPVACHFEDKHQLPTKPRRGKAGNARFDSTWLPPLGHAKTSHAVACVVLLKDGTWFIAVQGARLPTATRDAFPLGGGFYPTDLSADYHQHRERWTFLHSQLAPAMPAKRPGLKQAVATPLIGAFITTDKATFKLNGTKITVTFA